MRVLVIDDDAPTRALLGRLLSEASDIDLVVHAASPEEATALAEGVRPDAIVLDIVLGAQDGRDLIGALRLAAPEARILVLSALAAEAPDGRSLSEGADAFRTKSRELYGRLADELRDLVAVTPGDG